jgi:hypothetical protein
MITVYTIMIDGGKYSICWLLDLVRKESINPLTIESLAYKQFIVVLREDIQFNTVKYTISYYYAKDIIVSISNEQLWKAAIVDMYIQDIEKFMFHIEEYGKWPNNYCHLYITNLSRVKLYIY